MQWGRSAQRAVVKREGRGLSVGLKAAPPPMVVTHFPVTCEEHGPRRRLLEAVKRVLLQQAQHLPEQRSRREAVHTVAVGGEGAPGPTRERAA